MNYDLTYDLSDVGKNVDDAIEAEVAQTDIGELVQTMNQYNVVADPNKDCYIVNDDTHQYRVEIQHTDIGGEDTVMAYVDEADTGFTNNTLNRTNVMDDEEILVDPQDGAIFNDGSDFLKTSAGKAPSKMERGL